MNCDEAREMLAGYADGELSPVENDALAVHLQECGRCRQIVHDQQRVQHVFDQYPVPTVSDEEWDPIGKALRAELAAEGAGVALKTEPRTDVLEAVTPEPEAEAPAEPAETEAPAEAEPAEPTPPPRPAREVPAPGPGPDRTAARQPAPTLIMHGGRPRAGPVPLRWVAHVVGLAAAAAVILLGLAGILLDRAPPLEPSALARQGDVEILEMEVDPTCSVVLQSGGAGDVIAIWVEPEDPDG
ncbi:MAG: zf-HC2 domain-containing protein [Phycisphaerae bacterium]